MGSSLPFQGSGSGGQLFEELFESPGCIECAIAAIRGHAFLIDFDLTEETLQCRGGESCGVQPHADTHAFDGGGIHSLFHAVFREYAEWFAEVDGFADELISCGAEDGAAGRKIGDKRLRVHHVEGHLINFLPIFAAVNADWNLQTAKDVESSGAELIESAIEVDEEMFTWNGHGGLNGGPEQCADHMDIGVSRGGVMEAGDESAIGFAGEPSIAPGVGEGGNAVPEVEAGAAVCEQSEMVKADPRDLQMFGDAMAPRFRV